MHRKVQHDKGRTEDLLWIYCYHCRPENLSGWVDKPMRLLFICFRMGGEKRQSLSKVRTVALAAHSGHDSLGIQPTLLAGWVEMVWKKWNLKQNQATAFVLRSCQFAKRGREQSVGLKKRNLVSTTPCSAQDLDLLFDFSCLTLLSLWFTSYHFECPDDPLGFNPWQPFLIVSPPLVYLAAPVCSPLYQVTPVLPPAVTLFLNLSPVFLDPFVLEPCYDGGIIVIQNPDVRKCMMHWWKYVELLARKCVVVTCWQTFWQTLVLKCHLVWYEDRNVYISWM